MITYVGAAKNHPTARIRRVGKWMGVRVWWSDCAALVLAAVGLLYLAVR